MVDLNLAGPVALGLVLLALHLVSVTLSRALRDLLPSRLEDRCRRPGAARPWPTIVHQDERTEQRRRGAGGAHRTGAGRPAGRGGGGHVGAADRSPRRDGRAWPSPLGVGAVGYCSAGVVGRVFAEPVLDDLWPADRGSAAASGLSPSPRPRSWSAGRRVLAAPPTPSPGRPASRSRCPPTRRPPRGHRCRPPRVGPRTPPAGRRADPPRRLGGDDPAVAHGPLPAPFPPRRGAAPGLQRVGQEPGPALRRAPRRHRRRPLRQGPVRGHDRRRESPTPSCPASSPVRPTSSPREERLRPARRVPDAADAARRRARRVRRRRRPGLPGRPASRNSSATIDDEHDEPDPDEPGRRPSAAARVTRSTRRCPSTT